MHIWRSSANSDPTGASGFEVSSGFRHTRTRHSVIASNLSRGVLLRTWTARKNKEWLDAIQKVVTGDPGRP